MAAIGAIVGPALVVTRFSLRRSRLGCSPSPSPQATTFERDDKQGTGRLIAAPGDAKKEIRAANSSSRFAYGPAIAIGSVLAALIG